MKVLVTGASGFLGSHLCRALVEKGYEVSVLVRPTSNLHRLKELSLNFYYGDLWSREVLSEAVEGKDFIIHCAGLILAVNKDEYFRSNHEGTKNLLEVILNKNPYLKRLVYVSSVAAGSASQGKSPVNELTVSTPLTYYGESKLAGEKEVLGLKNRISVSVVRPPAIYGPSDRPTLNFFKFAKRGFTLRFGKEETFISLAHVSDVAQAIILAMERNEAVGEAFYVSDGEIYSWTELWETMASACGRDKIKFLKIPKGLFFCAANVAEFFGKLACKPSMLNYHKATDLTRSWAVDISKIKNKLGFNPVYKLPKGAKETYQWYRNEGWL